MAHSLRSKSKLRAKSIKRGKEFQKVVDERTQRLHEKAKHNLIKQKEQEKLKALEEGKEIKEDEDEESMNVDEKKVSTSGYRTSRNQIWKNKHKKHKYTSFKKNKKSLN